MAYRSVATSVKYWVVCKITEEKVVAKERLDSNSPTKTIEGSLEHVRRTLRQMDFYYLLPFSPNPEKIVEVWY